MIITIFQKIRKDLEFIVKHICNVDLDGVYETLKNDIPKLQELLSEAEEQK